MCETMRLELRKSVEIPMSCAMFCMNSRTKGLGFLPVTETGKVALGWPHLASSEAHIDSGKDWPGPCVVKY